MAKRPIKQQSTHSWGRLPRSRDASPIRRSRL